MKIQLGGNNAFSSLTVAHPANEPWPDDGDAMGGLARAAGSLDAKYITLSGQDIVPDWKVEGQRDGVVRLFAFHLPQMRQGSSSAAFLLDTVEGFNGSAHKSLQGLLEKVRTDATSLVVVGVKPTETTEDVAKRVATLRSKLPENVPLGFVHEGRPMVISGKQNLELTIRIINEIKSGRFDS